MAFGLATPTSMVKRKLYLINHDPITTASHIGEMGAGLSKFVVLQTINEFRDAAYNDIMVGELYSTEAAAKANIKHDEYYLIVSVTGDAISHCTEDGQIFIYQGFTPKILALKTLCESYMYNESKGFYKENASARMTANGRYIYNYNPPKWPLFAALK